MLHTFCLVLVHNLASCVWLVFNFKKIVIAIIIIIIIIIIVIVY